MKNRNTMPIKTKIVYSLTILYHPLPFFAYPTLLIYMNQYKCETTRYGPSRFHNNQITSLQISWTMLIQSLSYTSTEIWIHLFKLLHSTLLWRKIVGTGIKTSLTSTSGTKHIYKLTWRNVWAFFRWPEMLATSLSRSFSPSTVFQNCLTWVKLSKSDESWRATLPLTA